MPCDSGQGASGIDWSARQENDRMARALCEILGALEGAGADLSRFSAETRNWWAEHKRHDLQRQAAEKRAAAQREARAAALAKLTAEEKAALGIRG